MSVIHFQQYFDDFIHFLQKIDIFQKMVILANFSEFGHIGTFWSKIDGKNAEIHKSTLEPEKVVREGTFTLLSLIFTIPTSRNRYR